MASSTIVHWVVLQILRYLQGIVFQSLLLSSTSSLELCAHSYAKYGSDSLISWKCRKQSIVSLSSIEVEYRAMKSTTKEIVWLHWLHAYMEVFLSHPTPIYYDNKSTIQIAHNSLFQE